MMDIVGLIGNLISGAVGGNLAGAALKDQSLGAIGNTIAGLVGGTAGVYILQAVGWLNQLGVADMNIASIAGHLTTGLVSGGVLTAILGKIKEMMK
jgi:uncharacterized membrane protein YeaQ/YmgE (transglycosylase-associated protein family)